MRKLILYSFLGILLACMSSCMKDDDLYSNINKNFRPVEMSYYVNDNLFYTLTYTYDNDKLALIESTHANGLTKFLYDYSAYEKSGKISITHIHANGQADLRFELTYDNNRLTSVVDLSNSYSVNFAYSSDNTCMGYTALNGDLTEKMEFVCKDGKKQTAYFYQNGQKVQQLSYTYTNELLSEVRSQPIVNGQAENQNQDLFTYDYSSSGKLTSLKWEPSNSSDGSLSIVYDDHDNPEIWNYESSGENRKIVYKFEKGKSNTFEVSQCYNTLFSQWVSSYELDIPYNSMLSIH